MVHIVGFGGLIAGFWAGSVGTGVGFGRFVGVRSGDVGRCREALAAGRRLFDESESWDEWDR